MKEIASRTARSAAAVEPLLLSPCSVQAREWHATRGCNLGSGVGRGGVTADTHVPRRDSRSQPKPHCTKRRRLSFSCGAARFAPRPTRAHSSERGLILVERERAPASGVRSAIGSLPPTCMVTSYRMWPRLSVVPHARAWWQLVCERGVKHLPPLRRAPVRAQRGDDVRAEFSCIWVGRDQAALWSVLGSHIADFPLFSPDRETSRPRLEVESHIRSHFYKVNF